MISKPSFIIFIFKMMMHYSSVQPIKLKRKSTYHFLKEDFIEKSFMSCSRILLLRNSIVFDRRKLRKLKSICKLSVWSWSMTLDTTKCQNHMEKFEHNWSLQNCILNFKIQLTSQLTNDVAPANWTIWRFVTEGTGRNSWKQTEIHFQTTRRLLSTRRHIRI